MSNEKQILIDHTSLHSLRRRPISNEELGLRAREILQLIDYLLLSDIIWISNTEPKDIWDTSDLIIQRFIDNGLARNDNQGILRVANITPKQYHNLCKTAAPFIYENLSSFNLSDLRKCIINNEYELSPSKVAPSRFFELLDYEFGDSKSDKFINLGTNTFDWRGTACPALMNSSLFRWIKNHITKRIRKNDLSLCQLNTLFRWQINTQIARTIDENIIYYPAVGRALSLDQHNNLLWNKKINFIEQSLTRTLKQNESDNELKLLLSEIGPSLHSELPIFGLLVILSLNDDCNLEDLLKKIYEFKSDERLVYTSNWINETDFSKIVSICANVEKEVKKRVTYVKSTKFKSGIKARNVIKIPLIPHIWQIQIEGEFGHEKDYTLHNLLPWFRKRIRPTTVLSGFISEIFQHKDVYNLVMRRISSIIKE